MTKGIISSKNRIISGHHYIQIDAAVNEGNSGGPLLDSNGNVLGVITLKLTDAEGIGLATPITVVSDWLDGITTNPYVSSGNSSNTIDDDIGTTYGAPSESQQYYVHANERVNAALVVALSLSLLLNIMLGVILGITRKKNKPAPEQQSPDRTDFEIEFED